MASGSSINKTLGDAASGGHAKLTDPGSGGTINLQGKSLAAISVAGSCKLPNAPFGTIVFIRATGSATITAATGGGTIATLAANDLTYAMSVGDSSPYWEAHGIA